MTKENTRKYNWFKDTFFELTESDLKKLHRWESSLHRIYENQCNGYDSKDLYSGRQEYLDNKNEKSILKKLDYFTIFFNYKIKINDDPRGCAIKIYRKDKIHNSFDGESCIIDW